MVSFLRKHLLYSAFTKKKKKNRCAFTRGAVLILQSKYLFTRLFVRQTVSKNEQVTFTFN